MKDFSNTIEMAVEWQNQLFELGIKYMPLAQISLQWLGVFALLCYTLKALRFIWLWILPGHSIAHYKRPGAWGLVTGASAGIGYGCAKELAASGFNVIILGHKADELKQASKDLISENPEIKVKIITMDVLKATSAEIEKAVQKISDLPISVLVNNVGGVVAEPAPHMKYLRDYTSHEIDGTIKLNAGFMTQITKLMLPVLAQNEPSLVINMSSGGRAGLPGVAVYSGTKAYLIAIGKAISRELKSEGKKIDIIGITPGDVLSQANHMLPAGTITANDFAKLIFKYAPRAASKGVMELSPYWLHSMQIQIIDMMPNWLLIKAANDSMKERMATYEKMHKDD